MSKLKGILVAILLIGIIGVSYSASEKPKGNHYIPPPKVKTGSSADKSLTALSAILSGWTYEVTGPNGSASVVVQNLGDVVYFELDATAPDYVYGNILGLYDTTKLRAVSIEENPATWGFWTWWTTATTNPAYGGGGNNYYYDYIENTAISNTGSAWADAWTQPPYNGGGPVGSIEPGYGASLDPNGADYQSLIAKGISNITNLGAIRLYTSTYAGGMYGSVPLRLGFQVISTSNAVFDLIWDTNTAYNWHASHLTDYLRSSVTMTRPQATPNAPSNLVATPKSTSEIHLDWQDNSDDEQGFIIERKIGLYGTYAEVIFVNPVVSPSAPSMIRIPNFNLSPDTTYYYRAKTYNENGRSGYSNEVNATTFLLSPSDLTATAVSISQINLSWMDNSQTEEGFIIERWNGSGFIQIATVGPNIVAFSDANLEPQTWYGYRVKAYRQSNYSFPSEPVGIETHAISAEYLTDLVTQYYQQGLITNEGISGTYNSIISQLSAAQDSAARGNLTAYANQLSALGNHIIAQTGTHIETNAGLALVPLIQASQQVGVEIKRWGGGIRADMPSLSTPSPYHPECFTMTYVATISPTGVSGTYSWTVSPTDSSKVKVTGTLTGQTTSGTPPPPAIQVHAITNTDNIDIIFVFTPTDGTAVLTTHSAQVVRTQVIPEVSVDLIGQPIPATPTNNSVATSVKLDVGGSATINTNHDETTSSWELGLLENVISWTIIAYYGTTPDIFSIPQDKLPLLDHLTSCVPEYLSSEAFTPTGKTQMAVLSDNPHTREYPLQKDNTRLTKIKYYIDIIKWEIARNTSTGEIRYLWWKEFIIDYDVEYDQNGKGTVTRDDTTRPPRRGEGKGTWPNTKIPVLGPPLANDIAEDIIKGGSK
ncbi:MAG: fibronectin type III domain-containing protein [Candidatus Brocadiia bacterium]